MRPRFPRFRSCCVAAAALAAPGAAFAHGFGQRYDLPVPLWMWLTGAGVSIVLSFVVMAIFVRPFAARPPPVRVDLLRVPGLGVIARPWVAGALRAAAAGLFVLTVVAGFAGDQDPYRNLAPTMLWIVWWVGFAFVCALVGDAWALLNPLDTLYRGFERLRRRAGAPAPAHRPWPPGLGAWPAVVVFLCFAWAELLWSARDAPRAIAWAMCAYAALTWTGMHVFGRGVWLRNAEAFSLAFGVLARFAPTEVRVTDTGLTARCPLERCATRLDSGQCVNGVECVRGVPPESVAWNLRWPAIGLLEGGPVSVALMVFVLVMLARVSYDGFIETPLWLEWINALPSLPVFGSFVHAMQIAGIDDLKVTHTALLLAFPAGFALAFLGTCRAILAFVPAPPGARTATALACRFVLTLVPIAVAYHLAHYLSMLLITGQFAIPLLSDPLGLGWNLLGTAGYRPVLDVVGARFVWYTAVVAVVIGHVCSVYLAHVAAAATWPDRRHALASQVPMIGLMVGYTTLSLWILAQPIVG